MNEWFNNPPPAQNNNHAGSGAFSDPSMAFMQATNTINPAQFQNQAFLNGAVRNGSPAFHNPVYQTNPVIPSKRGREDSLGTSPRQAPGALPGSRSQTPGQGAYSGYNQNINGNPQYSNAPTPFQHLQTAPASNASNSPHLQNTPYSQANGVQRVATSSPNNFSPHHGNPQMSPAPSDHLSRSGTPHDNPSNFIQNSPYGAAMGQPHFNPGMQGGGGQMPMNPQATLAHQHMQSQNIAQRNYQIQLNARAQAHARQAQLAAQNQQMSNGIHNAGASMPNPQMAAIQHMQQQQSVRPPNSPEEFMRNVQTYMASINRNVNLQPVICERPVNIMQLFVTVAKAGSSIRISKMNQWPIIAQQLNFPHHQLHLAGQQLHAYWVNNLAPYEQMFISRKQHRPQGSMSSQLGISHDGSPIKQQLPNQENTINNHQRNQSDAAGMNGIVGRKTQSPTMNGYIPGAQDGMAQHKVTPSRQMDTGAVNGIPANYPLQSPSKREAGTPEKKIKLDPDAQYPEKIPIEDPFKPEVLQESRLHGAINVDEMFAIAHNVISLKPTNPSFRDLGIIDVHALNMSIKSGMHAEVRHALDTLTLLSVEQGLQLSLEACDDLVETLIDCAQDQVDFLAEHAAEVSDEMLITSYEDVLRGCHQETESLQQVHAFGSLEYDLDRAVDRLICITTLIRNFSFYESNFNTLGMPEVVCFLTNVVRHLGTKEMLLGTNRNTLDFMKDVIIYLSNLSHSIQLPGKEEALCLLHFLLSFAPCPTPVSHNADKLTFTMYNPNIHKYTPSAVDSLAKLLARDEPNRTYYKAIFSADSSSSPSFELLTRTFGLSICPLPIHVVNPRAVVAARKPFLLQGMLAAEILSNLAPGSDHGLARSWLDSSEGFAVSLLRLVGLLSTEKQSAPPPRHPRDVRGAPAEPDSEAYSAIAHRAMAVLRRLVEKSRTGDTSELRLPSGIMPKKETLLGAIMTKDIDALVLRQLCIYSTLEE